MDLLEGVKHLSHASLRIQREKIIYVDPFKIEGSPNDADIVFCTHDHFDHLSTGDIRKIIKTGSILVVPEKKEKKFKKWVKKGEIKEVTGVVPSREYEAGGISFQTVPAYNLEKKYHKKKEGWMGFIIRLGEMRYYIAGDSDYIPEMNDVEADVVFLPVGGTYTMDAAAAAAAANAIKPRVAVPIHFGSVVGTRADAESFAQNLDDGIKAEILLDPEP